MAEIFRVFALLVVFVMTVIGLVLFVNSVTGISRLNRENKRRSRLLRIRALERELLDDADFTPWTDEVDNDYTKRRRQEALDWLGRWNALVVMNRDDVSVQDLQALGDPPVHLWGHDRLWDRYHDALDEARNREQSCATIHRIGA